MFDIEKICGFDVDTLNDFMKSNGVLYKPETELIKPNLRLITSTLQRYGIKIICVNDRHYGDEKHRIQESELKVNGGPFDLHAEIGSIGGEKIPETLLSDTGFIPNSLSDFTESIEYFKSMLFRSKQIIIEKQSYDSFYSKNNPGGNVNIEKVIEILDLRDFFVYGVYTDYCIKAAALGLLARNKNVWVIKDAITSFNVNPDDGEKALMEMSQGPNGGVKFITTDSFVELLKSNFG